MTVCCSDCGLLTLRLRDPGAFLEADFHYRKEGNLYGELQRSDQSPLCLVQEYDLREEFIDQNHKKVDTRLKHLMVINKDRDCPRFIKWIQGVPPREHLDMQFAQVIQQQQREQRACDIEHAEQQRERDLAAAKEQREDDRRRTDEQNRVNRRIQIGLAVFAAVSTILTACITAYLNNKPEPKPQPAPVVNVIVPDTKK